GGRPRRGGERRLGERDARLHGAWVWAIGGARPTIQGHGVRGFRSGGLPRRPAISVRLAAKGLCPLDRLLATPSGAILAESAGAWADGARRGAGFASPTACGGRHG